MSTAMKAWQVGLSIAGAHDNLLKSAAALKRDLDRGEPTSSTPWAIRHALEQAQDAVRELENILPYTEGERA